MHGDTLPPLRRRSELLWGRAAGRGGRSAAFLLWSCLAHTGVDALVEVRGSETRNTTTNTGTEPTTQTHIAICSPECQHSKRFGAVVACTATTPELTCWYSGGQTVCVAHRRHSTHSTAAPHTTHQSVSQTTQQYTRNKTTAHRTTAHGFTHRFAQTFAH